MAPRNPSHKIYERRYKQHTRELAEAAGVTVEGVKLSTHLTMTDEAIDQMHPLVAKTTRNWMKRQAKMHRLREKAMQVIAQERQDATDK